ncbi:MAG TPA: hypothetical protein PKK61_09415 [Defluviitaleaceae bacterium]|nr:hypothetical protein [Defluviitaleaceae bacterium]
MNKNEVKKLFWNLVNGIEFCCDTITKNSSGVVVERGMALENDYSAMYVLDEGSIKIYDNHHNVIAEFTEDSEILYILKDLFEVLD